MEPEVGPERHYRYRVDCQGGCALEGTGTHNESVGQPNTSWTWSELTFHRGNEHRIVFECIGGAIASPGHSAVITPQTYQQNIYSYHAPDVLYLPIVCFGFRPERGLGRV